ncbi:MAG: sulfite exporter TauE/SafE family protein [Chloroflexi bacterium]|nr:sulfite exporter TauE/SafE family protein [Chloroflexota bacterium]
MSLTLLTMALGVFLAGIVNGATGLGFSIVAGAALALLLDAKTAVLLISVIVPILTSVQLLRHRAQVRHLRRILPLLGGGLLGVPLGTYLLAVLSGRAVALVLGAFTLLYVFTGFFKLRFRVTPRWEPLLAPLVGVSGGICNGAVGVSGPILASYLLALDMPASTFIFSLAVMFVVQSATRLVGLITLNQMTPALASLSLLLLPAGVLGILSGMWLQSRLPKQAFHRAVLLVLFAAGSSLIQRGLA